MKNNTPHLGLWICDERVGCVAVYAGPQRPCLDMPMESFIYYRHGKQVNGQWQVGGADLKEAHRIADSHNAAMSAVMGAKAA